MFTKLKNKIAEEVKQSPLKLSASVQQLAQVGSMQLPYTMCCQIVNFNMIGSTNILKEHLINMFFLTCLGSSVTIK
jgi:hypothetical protein